MITMELTCKYVIIILSIGLFLNYPDCQADETVHHHHHHKHHKNHHRQNAHHKRQTDSDKVLESSSWRKVVTTQNGNEEPIRKEYSWSSDSNKPSSTDQSSEFLREALRKITSQNQPNENTIDSRPIKLSPGSTSETSSQNVERIIYNISLTQSRGLGQPGSSGSSIFSSSSSSSSQFRSSCPRNHYGNSVVGCKKCECNDNIDLTDFDNCDSGTGSCLKCLYNTAGDHCERCKPGFTGDATKRLCRECVCNKLGTDPASNNICNPTSGQCPCMPHVEGLDCGSCQAGFFNLTSGKGCEACNCDPTGSVSKNCNQFDGKCECHSNYGGLKCNECPPGQFGDPKSRCQTCSCNREGSVDQNCDSKTGNCRCKTGIGGSRCDKCARGYFGRFPNCESCGECFEQWDQIIRALKDQTQALLDRVKLLLKIGTTGSYGKQFADIESNLDMIKYILDHQKLNEDDINDLDRQIKELAEILRRLEKTLTGYENDADSTRNRTLAVQEALREFDRLYENLNLQIDILRENATQFKEANVDGAYNIILDSQNRSSEAEKQVRNLKNMMAEQEKIRRMTESMLTSSAIYNSSSMQNDAILENLSRQIYELENSVPSINQLVCASTSTVNTCDQLCGGALCNKCGGLSCSEGATTKAGNALDLAQKAMALLNQKYNSSKGDLDALLEAKKQSEEALKQAKQVMNDCELQKAKFDKIGGELNGILDGVDKFYLMDGARPAEVRTLGNECLGIAISLKPDQILDLARRINETISHLTNIDKILQETAGDLNTAEQLHQQADRAKEMADNILDTVEQVLNMLRLAAIEQLKAAAAIAAATADIEGAQADLAEIGADAELLAKIVLDLTDAIRRLRDRLNELRKKYVQNELYMNQAKAAADEASKLADEAERGANELEDKVRLAEEKLRNKANQNGLMRDRAERLKNDAHQLAAEILMRMNLLRELDDQFDEDAKRLKDFQDIVDDLHRQMNEYIRDIDNRAQFYRECQT